MGAGTHPGHSEVIQGPPYGGWPVAGAEGERVRCMASPRRRRVCSTVVAFAQRRGDLRARSAEPPRGTRGPACQDCGQPRTGRESGSQQAIGRGGTADELLGRVTCRARGRPLTIGDGKSTQLPSPTPAGGRFEPSWIIVERDAVPRPIGITVFRQRLRSAAGRLPDWKYGPTTGRIHGPPLWAVEGTSRRTARPELEG